MTFQLDTTGSVGVMPGWRSPVPSCNRFMRWADLDAFTQGYIEAMFDFIARGSFVAGWPRTGFSDLAPETLARIIADCEAWRGQFYGRTYSLSKDRPDMGREFWRIRQEGKRSTFPPLTVQLGDDSKVRFA